ncbi:MAG: hypothetical protein HY342_00490 [Candidatus Lambdaproteobacteria bacterium]|nr:hypothetical protein [Candidatus Lambdaproteobacteria bacterium]
MRHLLGVIAAFAIVLWAVTPAHAISLSLDIPYSNTITSTGPGGETYNGESVGGYIVGISTPWWVGVSHEDYQSTISIDVGAPTKFELDVSTVMNNVYLELPVPVISAAIGYGVGTLTISASGDSDDYAATQYFARLGLRLAMMWDVHVGYHTGTATGSGTNDDLEFTTMTLGVGASF